MAEAAETPSVWEAHPPLSGTMLLGAGVRLVRAHVRPLAVLALALAAVTVAIRLGARSVGASTSSADFTVDYFAYEALVALATGVASGLALRVLLAEGRPRLRPDAGLAAYVAITAAGSLVAIGVSTLATSADPGAGLGEVGKVIAGFVGLLAVVYVFTKLLLWPIGRLMRDAGFTPARSWGLMHKASWAYIGAIVLAFLALLPVYVILTVGAGDPDTAPAPFVIVEHLATAVWVVASTAIAAAVYRARVLGQPLA